MGGGGVLGAAGRLPARLLRAQRCLLHRGCSVLDFLLLRWLSSGKAWLPCSGLWEHLPGNWCEEWMVSLTQRQRRHVTLSVSLPMCSAAQAHGISAGHAVRPPLAENA